MSKCISNACRYAATSRASRDSESRTSPGADSSQCVPREGPTRHGETPRRRSGRKAVARRAWPVAQGRILALELHSPAEGRPNCGNGRPLGHRPARRGPTLEPSTDGPADGSRRTAAHLIERHLRRLHPVSDGPQCAL